MKTIFYILIFTLPLTAAAQLSDKRYSAVEDFYSEIDIENIESNIETIEFNYNKDYLTIDTVVKYNYGLICTDTGKVISIAYINNNKMHIRLYKKETYYLRLDSHFSSKYYRIQL